MNTKGTKFLAVLAVLTMAFAGFAVIADVGSIDATAGTSEITGMKDAATDKDTAVLEAGTYILKNDGKIYTDAGVDTEKVYKDGIYCAGNLVLQIESGQTVTINTKYFGIITEGTLTIGVHGDANASTKLAITVADEIFVPGLGYNSEGGIKAYNGFTSTGVSLDIKADATSTTASSEMAIGIWTYAGPVAITLSNGQTADIFGGNRGIFSAGAATLNGGIFNLGGYESALTAYSGDITIGSTAATTATFKILDGSGVNGQGADARFAIKAKHADQNLIIGDTESIVTTQGLFTTDASAIGAAAKLIVTGGYVQNQNDDTGSKGGLFIINTAPGDDGAAAGLKLVDSVNSNMDAGKTNVVKGTDIHNYIIAGYSDSVVTAGATDGADINTAMNDSTTYVDQNLFVTVATGTIADFTNDNKLVVPENKSVNIAFTGDNAIKGTIDVSKAEELTVSGIKTNGTDPVVLIGKDGSKTSIIAETGGVSFTVKKGSVELYDITTTGALNVAVDGDFDIYGTVSGGGSVNVAKAVGATTATVAISNSIFIQNATVTITGLPVTITGVISIDNAAGVLTFAGASTVNVSGEIAVNAGTLNINGTTEFTLLDGGKLSSTSNDGTAIAVGSDKAVIVMTGSDINNIAPNDFDAIKANVVGKDAADGQWTYEGTTLTLDGYNGTYNFGPISAAAAVITVVGDNVVTFQMIDYGADSALFSNANLEISTTQGTGSLEIDIDMSKVSKVSIETFTASVISAATKLTVDSVSLVINVTGTNAAWTATAIKAKGINTAAIDIDNSILAVDVLGTYTADDEKVIGIVGGAVTANKSIITASSAGLGMSTAALIIKNESSLLVGGNAYGMKTTGVSKISGSSEAAINSGFELSANLGVSQDSIVSFEDLYTTAGTITNDAQMLISGDSVIKGTLTNKAVMQIEGTVKVYGSITNDLGTLTNNADITVLAKGFTAIDAATTITLGTATDETVTAKTAMPYIITINAAAIQDDGTVKVTNASVQFKGAVEAGDSAAIDAAKITNYNKYTGILTPSQIFADVASGYTLTLSNGTSSITVVYDMSDSKVTTGYKVTVTGTIVDAVTTPETPVTYALKANAAATGDVTDNVKAKITNTGASLLVNAGTFENAGTVASYGTAAQTIVAADAVFNGDITLGVQAATIAGESNGDITAAGAVIVSGKVKGDITATGNVSLTTATATVEGDITTDGNVAADGTVTGDIVADGTVTSTKKVTGDITAGGAVAVKDLTGNITVDANGEINVTVSGKMAGDIIYISEYYATSGAETKTEYTAKMTIDSDVNAAFIIILAAGQDAGASTPVVPGFFKLGAQGEIGTSKYANITLVEGALKVTDNFSVEERYAITIEPGTTLEVSNTATLDVKSAGLKVSSEATKNYVTGDTVVTTYGKVDCIMSFDIQSGAYTIYSDVAYALANCDEGSELTVEADAPISANVTIPKGVNVIVSNGVTVAFGAFDLSMEDDAIITLLGTGRVTFAKSGTTGEGDDMTYNTVNGTFVFGDNTLVLEDVRFNTVAPAVSTIAGQTVSEVEKLDVTLTYEGGTATLTTGAMAGTVTLLYQHAAPEELTAGKFVVAADTSYDGIIIDAAEQAKKAGNVITVVDNATEVVIDGTFTPSANLIINGDYSGDGKIVLSSGRIVTISGGVELGAVAGSAAATVSMDFVDTTDAVNGYELIGVSATATHNLVLTAAGANLVTIQGQFDTGVVNAMTTATLSGIIIDDGAELVADAVKLVSGVNAVEGILKTKALDLNSLVLGYDATYTDGDYTVYTVVANIDMDEITVFEIDGDKFGAAQQALFGDIIDLSGKDVTVTIKEDTILVLTRPMIIGTAATSLGAGASIAGTIQVSIDDNADGDIADVGDYDGFVIAYAGADISGAKFVGFNGTTAAGNSVFDIEGTEYATVFADKTTDLSLVVAADEMDVKITGFTFTYWTAYSTGEKITNDEKIGSTNATAYLVAGKVTITVTSVEGVTYYMDGVEFLTTDLATKVTVGSVITMKISDTTKYQGTPKIDGKTNYVVSGDSDGKTITATGVSPVEPPAPAPAGMSLTEILLIVLVVLIAIMVVIIALRLNRS